MEEARRVAVVVVGVAAAAVTGSLALRGLDADAPRLALFLGLAPSLAVVGVALALVPDRWFRPAQLAALVSLWLGWRAAQWGTGEGLASVVGTAVAMLVCFLPDRLWARRVQVGLATLAVAALFLVKTGWERPLVGAALQLVAVAGSPSRPTGLASLARAFFATNVTQTTPIPLDEAQRGDRALGVGLRGALWMAVAAPLHALGREVATWPIASPLVWLDAGQPAHAVVGALVLWAAVLADVAGIIFIDAGTLRLLGVPVSPPVLAPWKSRDMLDYWRRANVWRYRMLVEGYQRLFLPVAGPWMPVGVFLVFLASGLHHASTVVLDFFPWLRWTLEGLLCSANAAWNQWRQRRDVRRFVATGRRPWRAPVWAAAAAVVLAHGFLQNISRHDLATREVIRAWVGR